MSITHRLLVVESSREHRNFIKFGIERNFVGVDIDEASDFVDALTKTDQKFYDLVILNVVSPEVNGLEMIKTLKQNQSSKKSYILAMAYRDSKEEVITALTTGANSYILIPFSINELVSRLREIDEKFDRREHKRYVKDLDVVMGFEGKQVACELIDISLGGVLLDVDRYKDAPNVLDKVYVSIHEKTSSLILDAIVLRIQALDTCPHSKRVRYALKFLEMNEDKRDLLKRVVDSL